ncbi:MAG: YaaL family protein [Eubacteriales bacterium]|nr:YaaL family protein [Eubacteriales bacterium]
MKNPFHSNKKTVTYDEKYLVQEIKMTKAALDAAYSNFDNATDPDLIDCYIYQLNSEQKRYKYLLQKAKESEIESVYS